MMAAERITKNSGGAPGARLLDRLPEVRGRYNADVPLGQSTWFKVGGTAEVVFRPHDEADLAQFLVDKPADVPVTVIGVASNLLVRDGGISGVVIRLGREFTGISIDGDVLIVGAGGLDLNVALSAEEASLTGMEFLSGVPGTIGGALRMNAGAYGSEMKDIVISAQALDTIGTVHQLTAAELGFGYRHCSIPESWIFVSAVLQGRTEARSVIYQRMLDIENARKETQPVGTPTGGSTFANPGDRAADGARAWELIDRAGCRGLTRGGAMISELHCNFMINTGGATAADLEGLGEEVRRRVKEVTGVTLEWEIRRIGVALEQSQPEAPS